MSEIYTTKGGEVLDQIALSHYGSRLGTLELILAANPGLAAQPANLPTGLALNLPTAPTTRVTAQPVQLYD